MPEQRTNSGSLSGQWFSCSRLPGIRGSGFTGFRLRGLGLGVRALRDLGLRV